MTTTTRCEKMYKSMTLVETQLECTRASMAAAAASSSAVPAAAPPYNSIGITGMKVASGLKPTKTYTQKKKENC